MKPTYVHTCPKCRFLGAMWKPAAGSDEAPVVDWYVCEGSDPSVVARMSSMGSDYLSWPRSMVTREWAQEPSRSVTDMVAISPWCTMAVFMLETFET